MSDLQKDAHIKIIVDCTIDKEVISYLEEQFPKYKNLRKNLLSDHSSSPLQSNLKIRLKRMDNHSLSVEDLYDKIKDDTELVSFLVEKFPDTWFSTIVQSDINYGELLNKFNQFLKNPDNRSTFHDCDDDSIIGIFFSENNFKSHYYEKIFSFKGRALVFPYSGF